MSALGRESWPPDVISRGEARGSLYSEVPGLEGGRLWGGVSQCVLDDDYMGHPSPEQTDTTENMTFLQLIWWAIMNNTTCLYSQVGSKSGVFYLVILIKFSA